MDDDFEPLLRPGEPAPVEIVNPGGASRLLLIGDHAGNAVPATLGDLGVPAADLARHIGWDIGIDGLGRNLAARLDAVFVRQHYSRLVIDCNRDPAAPGAMPEVSDATTIPGNLVLQPAARQRRIDAIHAPYHAAIAAELKRGTSATVLVALHSFTPAALGGKPRPWHVGILHDGRNDGFARRLLDWLDARPELTVGDNEPYRMDTTDYTVPRHAFDAGLAYVEIEVRQDLLSDTAGIDAIATLLEAGLGANLANG